MREGDRRVTGRNKGRRGRQATERERTRGISAAEPPATAVATTAVAIRRFSKSKQPALEPALSPPAVYGENGGGNPQLFPVCFSVVSFLLHYFLENYTREPPITQEGGISMHHCWATKTVAPFCQRL